MKNAHIETLAVGPLEANCYLLADPETREVAIIDPGGDAEKIIGRIERRCLSPLFIINTHAHPDHIAANAALKKRYGAPLAIHRDDAPILSQAALLRSLIGYAFDPSPPPDRELRDGEELRIGKVALTVLHTPGHSPGSICVLCRSGDGERGLLFTGDTLFAGSVGRTDLPGGSMEDLLCSLREKILPLPDGTRILPGHGPATTLGSERRSNPFLEGL